MTIYTAMLTGPENMPVFGDNQLTPDEKRAIINYVQTIKTPGRPGRCRHRPHRPGRRGSGHLGRRHRRPAVRDLLDGEQGVSTARHPPRLDRRRGRPGPALRRSGRRLQPRAAGGDGPRRARPAGRPLRRRRDPARRPGPAPGSPLEKRAIRQVGAGLRPRRALRLPVRRGLRRLGLVPPDWHWQITESGWSAVLHPAARASAWAWPWAWSASAWCSSPRSCCRTRPPSRTSTTARTSTGSPPAPRWSGGFHNSGLARRKLITRSLGFMGAGLGLMLIMPLGRPDQEPEQGQPARHHRRGPRACGWSATTAPRSAPATRRRLPGDRLPGGPGRQQAGRRARRMLIRLRPEQVGN